jgi:hypothetical protein
MRSGIMNAALGIRTTAEGLVCAVVAAGNRIVGLEWFPHPPDGDDALVTARHALAWARERAAEAALAVVRVGLVVDDPAAPAARPLFHLETIDAALTVLPADHLWACADVVQAARPQASLAALLGARALASAPASAQITVGAWREAALAAWLALDVAHAEPTAPAPPPESVLPLAPGPHGNDVDAPRDEQAIRVAPSHLETPSVVVPASDLAPDAAGGATPCVEPPPAAAPAPSSTAPAPRAAIGCFVQHRAIHAAVVGLDGGALHVLALHEWSGRAALADPYLATLEVAILATAAARAGYPVCRAGLTAFSNALASPYVGALGRAARVPTVLVPRREILAVLDAPWWSGYDARPLARLTAEERHWRLFAEAVLAAWTVLDGV